ncbi:MAG TPA: Gfo/Idh/MocA family oxidoreductase [Jatrophihabitans sp.]|jgi:predicted dehydrogenase
MTPVKLGLVGYGFGGRYFHAPLITSAPECELVGVLTSSPERQGLIGHELPGIPTFDSLAALVDAGAEAVAISTPAHTHSTLTDQALSLKLAVVCDKPFALNPSAARETVERGEELELALSPYQNRRWDSDFLTVRKLVSGGALGTVTRFESRFERFAPQNGPGPSGGGTLLDFGSHLVDQALVLLGPVVAVYAELRMRESGLDDDVFLALTHDNGARSQLWGSWSQSAPGPRYRVTGTDATYVLTAGDTQEDLLIAGESPASLGEKWGDEPSDTFGTLHAGTQSRVQATERGRWDLFYPAFAGAVRGANPAPVNARDAMATAIVLEAAKTSAATGTVVAVNPS